MNIFCYVLFRKQIVGDLQPRLLKNTAKNNVRFFFISRRLLQIFTFTLFPDPYQRVLSKKNLYIFLKYFYLPWAEVLGFLLRKKEANLLHNPIKSSGVNFKTTKLSLSLLQTSNHLFTNLIRTMHWIFFDSDH